MSRNALLHANLPNAIDVGAAVVDVLIHMSYNCMTIYRGNARMRINARLDEVHSKKLEYLQDATQGGVSDVIKQAIDLFYQKVRAERSNASAMLRRAGFIGCGEASADLSETYKEELKKITERKHGYR